MALIPRLGAIPLVIALLGLAFALPEFSHHQEADVFLQERAVCYDDDTLLSFKYWLVDAEPYCSSLLGIRDIISTLPPAISRTTTRTVSSSVRTLPTTTTVAEVTAFTTVTITAGQNQKRGNAAQITGATNGQPQPSAYNYVQSMCSGANTNASIASSVYSACSCLNIAPKTVKTQSTTQSTRTITGSIVKTEAAATITSGTSTVTITETLGPQGGYYPYQVYTGSSGLTSSSSTEALLSGSFVPSVTASSESSDEVPSPSIAPDTFDISYSTGIGSSPEGGGASTTSAPYPAIDTSLPPTLVADPISSSTISSILPVGTSVNPAGCPRQNDTIYTNSYGQQYQLQCYRFYSGVVSIGLDQPNFRTCIEQCSRVNAGFSAIRCYGVTWLQYEEGGIHCNLKSQDALANYTTNYLAVSAVLLTGVPPPVVGQFRTAGNNEESKTAVEGKAQLPDNHARTWRMAKVPRRLRMLWRE
ncbi:MAG: hypothetical protein Q9180_001924 [Flavoplaca navasiana]